MNKVSKLSSLMMGLVILFFLGSCCPECDKPFLGEFSLTTEEAEWMEFTEEFTRQFRSDKGQELTFFYSDLQSGFEDLISDCDETACGFCCNEYRNGFLYTQLLSSDQGFKFDITLRKDFINYTPQDDPATIRAALSITFNEKLTCSVLDVPNVTFTETLNIGNRDFFQVFTCEYGASRGIDFAGEPVRFYFTVAEGIVGFEIADTSPGETIVWNLLN